MDTSNSTPSKGKKKDNKTSAKVWKERYDLAVDRQTPMFQKFADWYDLMYAHINTSQYALWRSKVFIPVIPAKAWAMVAKLTAMNPGFEVGLYGEALLDPDAELKAQKAQWKLEHDYDNPLFDESMPEKLFSPLVDAAVTGTGIAKIPWVFNSQTRYEKYQDEATGEVDVTQDVRIDRQEGYNDLIPQDVLSTFIAPGAKNLYSAAWVILEDEVTIEQLEQENAAAGFEMYKQLDEVRALKADAATFANEKKSRQVLMDQAPDSSDDGTVKSLKRLECYERSTMCRYVYIVGSGKEGDGSFVEVAYGKLPYWHGKYPLIAFYTKKRPHSFWGQGVFEDTERMQSAFNDIFNHFMDNANLSQDGMIMKQEGDEHTYIVEPGGEYIYKDKPPTQFQFPKPDASMFSMVVAFIESQIEEATISRYATGTPNSATDKTAGTASGITKLTEMAGDKIGFMKSNFANALRQVGRMWLSNNQQFMDEETQVMGTVEGQPKPVTVTPGDLQGQMVLRINDAAMEPMSKDEELAKFNAYLQQALQLQQASIAQAQLTKWATPPLWLNFGNLFQDLSQKMGFANFTNVVMNNDEVEKKMGDNPSAAYLTPQQKITYDLNELYGTEAGQLLQRDGIQPDPRRQDQLPVAADAGAAPAPEGPDPVAAADSQAKNLLQADKQQHDKQLDKANFMLDFRKQQHAEKQTAADVALKAQGQQADQEMRTKEFNKPEPKPTAARK
jgi:hypothetical protein